MSNSQPKGRDLGSGFFTIPFMPVRNAGDDVFWEKGIARQTKAPGSLYHATRMIRDDRSSRAEPFSLLFLDVGLAPHSLSSLFPDTPPV